MRGAGRSGRGRPVGRGGRPGCALPIGVVLPTGAALALALVACTAPAPPAKPPSRTPLADTQRLSLVNGAIDSGPHPAVRDPGSQGGGAAIVRPGERFAEIRTPDLAPGRFTVTALCLGHGTVRLSVHPSAPPGYPSAPPAPSAPVPCGFSESHGRDVLSGVLVFVGVAVTLEAAAGADGAVAYRIRED